MSKEPFDLDSHRGIAAQKATDLRRTLVEVENHAKELRDRQTALENQLLALPAESWPEAAAKARYVLNLYAASLSPEDTRHRNLVAAIFDDFARLTRDS
jgi:predicted  nucleic acid-binding Zn-ribbon protein